ncbi:unnamed protein product [Tilletia controversa]|uniref:Uncharacterized protein n=1 Tax=Tilletia caries TaxID=13290 RepID=A0A177SY88_9BASI|nr:hypothetical protein CF336_g9329 [Tilletia laevis]KAE8180805.1 hypothetical protein CF335_g9137 [Tilletia laevis]KAE8236880.1 hypothetical protein A4X03_0g9293 [Tilletia caries]CAD6918786.1 unnamed protein product [Tilletia controversa]
METQSPAAPRRLHPRHPSALDIRSATSALCQQAIVGDAERERAARIGAVRRAGNVAKAQAKRVMEMEMEMESGVGAGSDFADDASLEHRTHRGREEPTTHPVPSQRSSSTSDDEPDFNPIPQPRQRAERSVAFGDDDDSSKLSPVHVWGVQKWSAGRWGEGC